MRKLSLLMLFVLLIVASCSKKSTPTKAKEVKPVPTTESKAAPASPASSPNATDAVAAGVNLFSGSCARCHGATGVEGRAPNLAQTSYSRGEIVGIIMNGQGHMPGFADKLSSDQIASIASYVATLKK